MSLSPYRFVADRVSLAMTEYSRQQLATVTHHFDSHDTREQNYLIALWTERVLCSHTAIIVGQHGRDFEYTCPHCGLSLLEER